MNKPDFICTDLHPLHNAEISFLLNQFPNLAGKPEEAASFLLDMPSTLESLLSSERVARCVLDQDTVLQGVSPFLLFAILLRQALPDHRSTLDRQVMNYLANLLALFMRAERMHQVTEQAEDSHEYIVDMLAAAHHADTARRFQIHAHIANYALFLTGVFRAWLIHRHRYHRSLLGVDVYGGYARTYYYEAANNPCAGRYRIQPVFRRIAQRYDTYVAALDGISRRYLQRSA